eukprot:c10026_g1_i3.p1 GENE.c10026_g1_i3~~c10026_g1_i3.p1  ORF type:complete len:230 (-),score=63.85 c10026_g1_i3:47-736(-)
MKSLEDGSTALIVLIADGIQDVLDEDSTQTPSPTHTPPTNRKLIIVNLGDSRAVCCRSGRPLRLSDDHKPNRWDERRRIEKAGGYVVNMSGVWRVTNTTNWDLGSGKARAHVATSRTFGDRDLKEPPILISDPEIRIIDITDKDLYVVIACDGIWDVLSDQDVIDVANQHIGNASEMSAAINRRAFQKNSEDNLTCTIVEFGWNAQAAASILKELENVATSEDVIDLFA